MITLARLLPLASRHSATPAAPPRLAFALLLVLGLAWRCTDATEWPFPYAPTVQYESAMAARMIRARLDPASHPHDQVAWAHDPQHWHIVSPPIMTGLTAACYMVAGEEIPWVSKLIGAAFWTIGGWFLHRAIVLQTGSRWAALAGLTYFTFCPFGLAMCRSFMVEPVMMCGFAIAVWRLSSWNGDSGWRDTLTAGIVCGVAAAGKPGVLLPPLAAAFAFMALGASGGRWRKLARIAVFTALLALPSFTYVLLVLNHRGSELNPRLLLSAEFYQAVATILRTDIGLPAIGLGLVGIAIAARSRAYLPLGLAIGFLGYVALFTFHCSTHNYYHLPLTLILALGIGWLTAAIEKRLPDLGLHPFRVRLVIAVLGVFAYVWFSRLPWLGPWRYSPEVQSVVRQNAEQDRHIAERDRQIETILGPRAKIVALAEHSGFTLEYHTNLRVTAFWYDTQEMENRLAQWNAEGCGHFVITDFAAYEETPNLKAALGRRRIVAAGDGFLIVDLRANRTSSP